jgi:demethylmenaquinone methyltransferase/2-methoxy-6-polyprenyl-1,4-benzoquinol methylase
MNKQVVKNINNNGKKEQVRQIFDSIATKYDRLDHLMSLGIDHYWRRKAIKELSGKKYLHILDIATGTADLALTAKKKLTVDKITGIDISNGMLEKGREKVKNENFQTEIILKQGEAEDLQFEDNTFDAVTVGFGVRNFEDLQKGLLEIKRVLKKDGKLIILEFSYPTNFIIKQLYLLYFNVMVPIVGRLFTKNKVAYRYLPGSVYNFPYGKSFIKILDDLGFINSSSKKLSLGICTVYSAIK